MLRLLTICVRMNLLRKSLETDSTFPLAAWGHLILRASIGIMIFYIHGLHKLEGGLTYLQHGTPWTLAKEVAEMHFPAPVASAFAATAVQFLCSPLVALGLFTRLNAALLTGTLSVAILQKTSWPGGIHNWRSFTSSFCLAWFFLVAAGSHLMLSFRGEFISPARAPRRGTRVSASPMLAHPRLDQRVRESNNSHNG